MTDHTAPIIIIGAGLVGLTLAQALKKEGFNFKIYDRDRSLEERPAGWGITMHWALPALESCLPPEVYNRLLSIQVDPVEENDRYRFLNLETGHDKFCFPSSTHYRLNRKAFRQLLSTDLQINWGKRFLGFDSTERGVKVNFDDGTFVEGSMLLAVDGKNSPARKLLIGDERSRLNSLPVAFVGISLRLSPEKVKPFREIHPIIWQGTHPGSGYYIFFSMLSTPQTNGSAGTADEYYEGQFNMSWLLEKNGPLAASPTEILAQVKDAAVADTGFFPSLKQAILDIPEGSPMLEIKLEDWPTEDWPSAGGKVAIVGDAAHAMTMYRGEAANHGICDAARLRDELVLWRDGKQSLDMAFIKYQKEVKNRTHDAVIMSRHACLDCHDLETLEVDSPVFQVTGFNALAVPLKAYI
ncbi:para-nitrobenzyl esterase [Penicillium macrosclerotiorum]|uniref:para-nitrobenzyl esterase n=1 Tax=Penicillium macrosclerotiorum TaxID=303699 RepID=UPI0025493152|nr:para-nitrobenzyl esterase [Penicillium macrosclerotiorum]KAJ5682702.1 para-nitrobenzyl esterase [Penicillium macrosclerotiorum]